MGSFCIRTVIVDVLMIYFTELHEVKDLITEADEKRYPESELLQNLVNAVSEADKCASVANQLVTKKVRTRLVT